MSDLEDELLWQIRAARLPEPVREYRFVVDRKFRADFAFPDRLLLIEVDGGSWVSGRHTRGSGFEADCEKASLAAVGGWRVLRFTGAMVRDGRALAFLEAALKEDAA